MLSAPQPFDSNQTSAKVDMHVWWSICFGCLLIRVRSHDAGSKYVIAIPWIWLTVCMWVLLDCLRWMSQKSKLKPRYIYIAPLLLQNFFRLLIPLSLLLCAWQSSSHAGLTDTHSRRLDTITPAWQLHTYAGLTVTHFRLLDSYTVSVTHFRRLDSYTVPRIQRWTMTIYIDTEDTINRTLAPNWF